MKGTYVLLLKMDHDEYIQIGKLGKLFFKKGFYAYVGSGLENFGRLERHINIAKGLNLTIKWHIDYLLTRSKIEFALVIPTECTMKCDLAIVLEKDIKIIQGFGCTDYLYDAHLFYSENELKEKINNICKKFGKVSILNFKINEIKGE